MLFAHSKMSIEIFHPVRRFACHVLDHGQAEDLAAEAAVEGVHVAVLEDILEASVAQQQALTRASEPTSHRSTTIRPRRRWSRPRLSASSARQSRKRCEPR